MWVIEMGREEGKEEGREDTDIIYAIWKLGLLLFFW